jgi:hypothetical protein
MRIHLRDQEDPLQKNCRTIVIFYNAYGILPDAFCSSELNAE